MTNTKKTMSYVIKTFYFTYLLYNKVGIHPVYVMYNIIMPSIKGTKNLAAQKEVAQHP